MFTQVLRELFMEWNSIVIFVALWWVDTYLIGHGYFKPLLQAGVWNGMEYGMTNLVIKRELLT